MNNNSFSLMYHDVLDHKLLRSGFQNPEAHKYKIEKRIFEEQIEIISRNIETNKIDKNNLFLTFDDGGISFIDIIAPILEKYGLKGYFFITTNFINKEGFISRENIMELYRRGHFIGIHSHTHPQNISLLREDQIRYEWEKSLKILRDILKKDILYASIPGGFFSKRSLSVLQENGIKIIFTSDPISTINEKNGVKILGRFAITKRTRIEDLPKLMHAFSLLRIRKIAIWKLLALLKKFLGTNYFIVKRWIKI